MKIRLEVTRFKLLVYKNILQYVTEKRFVHIPSVKGTFKNSTNFSLHICPCSNRDELKNYSIEEVAT